MIQGNFQAKCVKLELGANNQNKPVIRGQFEILDGTAKGTRVPYEGKLDEKGIKYTKRDMLALGWKGVDIRTLVDDVAKAAVTVPVEVEIARWDKGDGTKVREWSTVRSVGRGGAPLSALDEDKLRSVNDWFKDAGDLGDAKAGGEEIPF